MGGTQGLRTASKTGTLANLISQVFPVETADDQNETTCTFVTGTHPPINPNFSCSPLTPYRLSCLLIFTEPISTWHCIYTPPGNYTLAKQFQLRRAVQLSSITTPSIHALRIPVSGQLFLDYLKDTWYSESNIRNFLCLPCEKYTHDHHILNAAYSGLPFECNIITCDCGSQDCPKLLAIVDSKNAHGLL